MNKIHLYIVTILLFSLHEITGQTINTSPPEGIINGIDWQMVSGRAKKYPNKEGQYRIEMTNFRIDDICHPFNLPGTVLEFIIEFDKALAEEVKCPAKLYYENTDAGTTGEVKVKLTTCDKKTGLIKGTVVAYFDLNGKIIGTFIIDWCPGL